MREAPNPEQRDQGQKKTAPIAFPPDNKKRRPEAGRSGEAGGAAIGFGGHALRRYTLTYPAKNGIVDTIHSAPMRVRRVVDGDYRRNARTLTLTITIRTKPTTATVPSA